MLEDTGIICHVTGFVCCQQAYTKRHTSPYTRENKCSIKLYISFFLTKVVCVVSFRIKLKGYFCQFNVSYFGVLWIKFSGYFS